MTEHATNQTSFSGSSDYNALCFLISSMIRGTVNTAIPVRVDSVTRSGTGGGADYLSATPLIQQRDAEGNALQSVSIPKLRWFRLQHGSAAIVCDPKPGDVGLAIFAQQDVSTLSGGEEPVQPGSFRCFDMSDGFYIGGFWGKTPKTFIHIEESGDIVITAPASDTVNSPRVTINCETCSVNASGSVTVDTPQTTVTGDVLIQKTLTVTGKITGGGGLAISGGGGATVSGSVKASGDVVAGAISVQSHVHGGVQGGSSDTGTPK